MIAQGQCPGTRAIAFFSFHVASIVAHVYKSSLLYYRPVFLIVLFHYAVS